MERNNSSSSEQQLHRVAERALDVAKGLAAHMIHSAHYTARKICELRTAHEGAAETKSEAEVPRCD